MIRLFVYLLLLGLIWYAYSQWREQKGGIKPSTSEPGKKKNGFRPKKDPMEPWVQVYETSDWDEARQMQARIQEEDMECILYEQGKKDIRGNELKGIGIAVPKSAMGRAQGIIARMPV